MSEKTTVIGFDLGHGETALAIIDDAYTLRGKDGIQPRPVFTVKSQPTVLATLLDGRKVWGSNAIYHTQAVPDQVSEFEICFKTKPGRELTDNFIQEFASCIHGDAIAALNGHVANRTEWFIGCPSAWNEDTRNAYARLFGAAGFNAVTVVKESRAAFTYYFEKAGGLSIVDLQEPTVVLDFGSSTLDATLAIGLRDEELDPGCPLGATWIDKAILHWNLRHCSQDDFPAGKQNGDKIAAFLAANRFERSRVELKVREAKEYYFNKHHIYPDAKNSYEPGTIKVGDHKFRIVLHGEMMQELMNSPLDQVVPELGVPWIDKAILDWNLQNCDRADFPGGKQDGAMFAARLAANPNERNYVELNVSSARELYVNNAIRHPDAANCYETAIRVGDMKIRIIIHGKMMQEIVAASSAVTKFDLGRLAISDEIKRELMGMSWLGRLERFLADISTKLASQGIKTSDVRHVLLTGGASRMQPVRQMVKDFFSTGHLMSSKQDNIGIVEHDTEPELCIARGLACWGRTAIQGESFRDDVCTELFGKFTVNEETMTSLRKAEVPESVIAKMEALRSLPETKRHPDAFLAAIAKALDKDELAKFQDLIVEHTQLLERRLLEISGKQYEGARFEDIVGDKWAEIALSRLRSWHNKNTSRSNLGPSIARELRQWSTSGELEKVIKSRVERLETAIRKEVNALVEPLMKKYQITNVTFMERTPLFEKMVPYYKADAETFAKFMEGNTVFADLDDSWWTRWIVVSDSDLEAYVKRQQSLYSRVTYKELYENKDNLNLFVALIYVPVGKSIERAITATQYLIAADMDTRSD